MFFKVNVEIQNCVCVNEVSATIKVHDLKQLQEFSHEMDLEAGSKLIEVTMQFLITV